MSEGDVSLIQDEDVLRRMWQQTEDFGKKKEIRAHMYRLREDRLRDLYSAGEGAGSGVVGGAPDDAKGGARRAPHSDSFADQCFQSLKSKEVRDSESPTRDYNYKMQDIDNTNAGWAVTSAKEVSDDGRTHSQRTVAHTSAEKAIDGGNATFAAVKDDQKSVTQYEDDTGKHFNATRSHNTAAQENFSSKTDDGSVTSSKSSKQSTSQSSYSTTSQHFDSNQDPNVIRSIDDNTTNTSSDIRRNRYDDNNSSNIMTRNIDSNENVSFINREKHEDFSNRTSSNRRQNVTQESTVRNTVVTAENVKEFAGQGELISRKVDHPDEFTKVVTETRELPDGTRITSTSRQTKGSFVSEAGKRTTNRFDSDKKATSTSEKFSNRHVTGRVDDTKLMSDRVTERSATEDVIRDNSITKDYREITDKSNNVRRVDNETVEIINDNITNRRNINNQNLRSTNIVEVTSDDKQSVHDQNEYCTTRKVVTSDNKHFVDNQNKRIVSSNVTEVTDNRPFVDNQNKPTDSHNVVDVTSVDRHGKTVITKNIIEGSVVDRRTVTNDDVETIPENRRPFNNQNKRPSPNNTVDVTTEDYLETKRNVNQQSRTVKNVESVVDHEIRSVTSENKYTDEKNIHITKEHPNDKVTRPVDDIAHVDKRVLETEYPTPVTDRPREKTPVVTHPSEEYVPEYRRPAAGRPSNESSFTKPTSGEYVTTYQTDYTTKKVSENLSPTHNAWASSLRASPDSSLRGGSPSRSHKTSTSSLRSSISPDKRPQDYPKNRSDRSQSPKKSTPDSRRTSTERHTTTRTDSYNTRNRSPTKSPEKSPTRYSPNKPHDSSPQRNNSPNKRTPDITTVNRFTNSTVQNTYTRKYPTGESPSTSPTRYSPSKSPSRSYPTPDEGSNPRISPSRIPSSTNPTRCSPPKSPTRSYPSSSPTRTSYVPAAGKPSGGEPSDVTPNRYTSTSPTRCPPSTSPTRGTPSTRYPSTNPTRNFDKTPKSQPGTSPAHEYKPSNRYPDSSPTRGSPSTSPTRTPSNRYTSTSPTRTTKTHYPDKSPSRSSPSVSPTRGSPTKTSNSRYPSSPSRNSPSTSPTRSSPTKAPNNRHPSSSPTRSSPSVTKQTTTITTHRTSSTVPSRDSPTRGYPADDKNKPSSMYPTRDSSSPTYKRPSEKPHLRSRDSSPTTSVSEIEFITNKNSHLITNLDDNEIEMCTNDDVDFRHGSEPLNVSKENLSVSTDRSDAYQKETVSSILKRNQNNITDVTNTTIRKSSLKKSSIIDDKHSPDEMSPKTYQITPDRDVKPSSTVKKDNPDKPQTKPKEKPPFVRSETYEERCRKILGMPDKKTLVEGAEKNLSEILGILPSDKAPAKYPSGSRSESPRSSPERELSMNIKSAELVDPNNPTPRKSSLKKNTDNQYRNLVDAEYITVDDTGKVRPVDNNKLELVDDHPMSLRDKQNDTTRFIEGEMAHETRIRYTSPHQKSPSPPKGEFDNVPHRKTPERMPTDSPRTRSPDKTPSKIMSEPGHKTTEIDSTTLTRKHPAKDTTTDIDRDVSPRRSYSPDDVDRSTRRDRNETIQENKTVINRITSDTITKKDVMDKPGTKTHPRNVSPGQKSPDRATPRYQSPKRAPSEHSNIRSPSPVKKMPTSSLPQKKSPEKYSPSHIPSAVKTPSKVIKVSPEKSPSGKPCANEKRPNTYKDNLSKPNTTFQKKYEPTRTILTTQKYDIFKNDKKKNEDITKKRESSFTSNITPRKVNNSRNITTEKTTTSFVSNNRNIKEKRFDKDKEETDSEDEIDKVRPRRKSIELRRRNTDDNKQTEIIPTKMTRSATPKDKYTSHVTDTKITRTTSDITMKPTRTAPIRVKSKPEINVSRNVTKNINVYGTNLNKASNLINKVTTTTTVKTTTRTQVTNNKKTAPKGKPALLGDTNTEDDVLVDIQQAKSSRETSPDRICPMPAGYNGDTGKPRFPDKVTEPDDYQYKKKTIREIITESDTDLSDRKIIEISDEEVELKSEDDDCLLSVNEKVSKFTSSAKNSKNVKVSPDARKKPFKKVASDDVEEDLKSDDCLLSVSDKVSKFKNVTDTKKKTDISRDFIKQEINSGVDSVNDKVSRFLTEAEKITEPIRLTSPAPKVGRPDLTMVDDELKTDECLLSVSDKVNKFINTAEKLIATDSSPGLVSKASRMINDVKNKYEQFENTSCDVQLNVQRETVASQAKKATAENKYVDVRRHSTTPDRTIPKDRQSTPERDAQKPHSQYRESSPDRDTQRPHSQNRQQTPDRVTQKPYSSHEKQPTPDRGTHRHPTSPERRHPTSPDRGAKKPYSSPDRANQRPNTTVQKQPKPDKSVNKTQHPHDKQHTHPHDKNSYKTPEKTTTNTRPITTLRSSEAVKKAKALFENIASPKTGSQPEIQYSKGAKLTDIGVYKKSPTAESVPDVVPKREVDTSSVCTESESEIDIAPNVNSSKIQYSNGTYNRPGNHPKGSLERDVARDKSITTKTFVEIIDKNVDSTHTQKSPLDREHSSRNIKTTKTSAVTNKSPERYQPKSTVTEVTTSEVVSTRRGSGKFGVELRRTSTDQSFIPERRRSSVGEPHHQPTIEDIQDLTLLEQMLEKVTGYEQRRRIRAQIRIVRKNMENTGHSEIHNERVTTSKQTSHLKNNSHVTRDDVKLSNVEHRRTSRTKGEEIRSTSPGKKQVKTVVTTERIVTPGSRNVVTKTTTETTYVRSSSPGKRTITTISPDRKREYSPSKKTQKVIQTTSPDRKRDFSPDMKTRRTSSERVYSSSDRTTRVNNVETNQYTTETDYRSISPERTGRKPSTEKYTSPSPKSSKVSEYTTAYLRKIGASNNLKPEVQKAMNVRREEKTCTEYQTSYTRKSSSTSQTNEKSTYKVDESRRTSSRTPSPEKHADSPAERLYRRSPSPDFKIPREQDVKSKNEYQNVYSTFKTKTSSKDLFNKSGKQKSSEDKPEWAKTNILRKTSATETRNYTTKKTDDKKTIKRSQSPSKTARKPIDVITSSYGIGPTDEHGMPLFGIRALRKQNGATSTYEVKGTVVRQEFHSENGGEPEGQVTMTAYSTNPEDLDGFVKSTGGHVTSTKNTSHRTPGVSSVTATTRYGASSGNPMSQIYKQNKAIENVPSPNQARTVRRGSVKSLTEKFIKNAVETTKSEKSSYPKAGLILRTSSFKDNDASETFSSRSSTPGIARTESNGSVNSGGEVSSTVVERHHHSQSGSSSSFLDSRSKVTGVQDILTRMKNADIVVEDGDTMEDAEARALLNKFLGATVLMAGMEGYVNENKPKTGNFKQESRTTVTTKISADIDDIWDERILRKLLEECADYEERRRIRARLRQVMAEQEACAQIVAEAAEEGVRTTGKDGGPKRQFSSENISTVETTTSTTTQKVSSVSGKASDSVPKPKTVSPFAKFRQLDKQNSLQSNPRM